MRSRSRRRSSKARIILKMVLLEMWPLMILLRKAMRVLLLRLQTDSPISMAKPSTMENSEEMVEGKVDNKRKIKKGKILDSKGEEDG
jgi:hypothetical protein